MDTRRILPLAFSTALLITACTGGSGGAPTSSAAATMPGVLPPGTAPAPTSVPRSSASPPASNAQGIDGRIFLSTGLAGRDLVAGSRVRLGFAAGQISASAGCNSMGGPYSIAAGRLSVGGLAMTEMGCDQALMAQDQWLAGLLDGAAVALDGDTLTLSKGGVVLTLLDRRVADPDRPLLGTRWVLDGMVSGGAVSSVPVGITAAITFADGRVSVETGCNSGGATVEVTDTTLAFGPLSLTKRGCPGDAASVERAVTAVLAGTIGYRIEADALILDTGAAGLTFRAAP